MHEAERPTLREDPGRGELMNSRTHGSEKALAELACARIARVKKPRLLIGGLLGCGSLIKPIALLVPILLLIYWLTSTSLKRSLVGTCVTMLTMVIVVSPWMATTLPV